MTNAAVGGSAIPGDGYLPRTGRSPSEGGQGREAPEGSLDGPVQFPRSLGRGTVGPEGPDGPQVSRGFGTDTSVGAWAGAPAPPLPLTGDTGATSPGWSIDWLAVTIWGVDADRVARLVSEAFHLGREVGVEGWTLLGGARFYGRRHEYLGATLLSECQSKGAEDNVHVVLPGDACAVGVDALLQLLTRLKMWSSRCAVVRLDLAVDSVPFTPLDAYRAVLAGQTVSWVKRGRDGLVDAHVDLVQRAGEGNTLYVGRRSSRRCVRIYDRRGPTRIELETKDAYAHAVVGRPPRTARRRL